MFGSFKVQAGDFVKGDHGQFIGGSFFLGVPGKFRPQQIPIADVEELNIATEENVKRLGGAVGWGVAGGLLFGPVGLLAGLMMGGRKKLITFVCKFKDGRKFLGTADSKTWTAIMAARLADGPRELPRVTAAAKYGLESGWKPRIADPCNLPLDHEIRPGSVMRRKQKMKDSQMLGVALAVVGLFVLLSVVVIVAVTSSPSPSGGPSSPAALPRQGWETRPERDGPWRVALVSGDGNDWVKLSEADKTTLCRKAASDLGHGERHARAYRDFLEGVFRRPDPGVRSRPIVETLAACHILIDKGTIRLE